MPVADLNYFFQDENFLLKMNNDIFSFKTILYDVNSGIINLCPNPNDSYFTIEFVQPLQNGKSAIIITDLAGKKITNDPILKEETVKQFDISYIKPGIYIMMITDKEILVTKKCIKK